MEKWLDLYQKGAYSWSLNIFSQYTTQTAQFNQGNTLYKLNSFSWALNLFLENSYDSLHNKGNTQYYLWLQNMDIEEKKKYWQKSLEAFTWAYQKNPSLSSQKNYEFVEKKLRELIPPPSSASSEDQEKKTATWSKTEKNDPSKDTSEDKDSQESQKSQQDQKSWSAQNSQNSPYTLDEQNPVEQLSPLEREKVQRYMNQLEQVQDRNRGYFNKKPSPNNNPFEWFVDPFTWEALFEGIYNNEKDW